MFPIFSTSTTLIFLSAVFLLLHVYFSRKFNYWKNRNVFFFKPIPFFGNMLPLFAMKTTIAEWIWEKYDQAGDRAYFGVYMFDQPVLVIKSAQLVKSILSKDFSHFENRSVNTPQSDEVMSNLMFFKKAPEWKMVRSKMSPVFTSGKLKAMFPLVLNEGNEMIKFISKLTTDRSVEAKEVCAKFSTNVIARCAFAVDAQSFTNKDAEFRQIGRRMFDFRLTTAMRQFASWFCPNIIKIFQIQFFDSYVVTSLKDIFTHVLHQRMSSTNLKGNDLVDILLEVNRKQSQEKEFCESGLVGQAIQFFTAGFETVSATLSFALYEICLHSDVQEKLRQEIMESIEGHNGLTYEGISEMKYLDMCVAEALRKYPVLPFLDRMCNINYKVPDSDLVIEKGIPVYIPMFGLHYDEKYFPDPKKFDPERFADKNTINKDGYYYVPFGEGPRICIGNRFGLLGVKVGICSILSKYKLERSVDTPVPIKFETKSLLLQSNVGIPLKFAPI